MSKGVDTADMARSGRSGPAAGRARPERGKARQERGKAASDVSETQLRSGPASVPDSELLHEAAETFAMLASPTRLHLLWLLSRGESDVGTLAEAVDGSDAMVSQHLAKLRLADLVTARREGKRQIYVVDDDHVTSLIEQALDHHGRRRGPARG